MRSPLLDLPGAVEGDGVDAGVAVHYGDPLREQRRLSAGEAVVDLSHRPVLRVSGADRLSWLHSLTSQHLERLAPGESTQALVLSPHGHAERHLALADDGEAVWAHVEPGSADALVGYLTSMRFMLRVEVADVSDAWAVVTVPEGLRVAGLRIGDEVLVPRAELPALADRVRSGELRAAGTWASEALRIEAHRPRAGLDTDRRTIPHEVGWIGPAVHLDKGCYRGQETVARVHNLGRPPRRLVFLHLDGTVETLPAHGTPVTTADGREVGTVTSSARHHELGPVALALVKRSVPVDAPLAAGEVAAAQEVVVPPDAGRNAPRPVLRQVAVDDRRAVGRGGSPASW